MTEKCIVWSTLSFSIFLLIPTASRVCLLLSSSLCFEPVHRCSHAEHTHEGALGLLIARRNRSPFFHAGPEALDEVAVLVDPGRTSHRCLVAPGRDGRARAEAPDQHAEGM